MGVRICRQILTYIYICMKHIFHLSFHVSLSTWKALISQWYCQFPSSTTGLSLALVRSDGSALPPQWETPRGLHARTASAPARLPLHLPWPPTPLSEQFPSRVVVQFYMPTTCVFRFQLLLVFTHIWCFTSSGACAVAPYWGLAHISLMSHGEEHCRFWPFKHIPYEVPVHIFGPLLLIEFLVFLLGRCRRFFMCSR